MTRRFVLAYLGACLCLAWAVLTAIAHFRRPVPATRYTEPEDGIQPWDWYARTMAGGPSGEWREFHD